MPIIRAKRQVSLDKLPGVRRTASETEASVGVGVEVAKARQGESIARLGGIAATIGLHEYGRMQQEERDYADQVFAVSVDSKLSKTHTTLLYGENGQGGALNRLGKDALGTPEETAAAYRKVASELEASATNPRQQAMVARLVSQQGQSLDLVTRRHVFEQMRAYGVNEINSSIENNLEKAATLANEPDLAAVPVENAVASVRLLGPKVGWGPEEIDKKVAAVRNAGADAIITRLLVNDKDQQAKKVFDKAKASGMITGQTLTKLEGKVDDATTMGDGLRTSEALWTQYGPKTNNDPILIADMEAAAREKYADDPKTLRATIAFLRERKAGVDAQRKEVAEAKSGSIYLAASQGATLQQLKQMPAFLNSTEKEQADAIEYVVNRAIRQANLAQAEEGRAYTKKTRADAEKTTKGWARYWDESSPTRLAQTSEAALHAMRAELGDDHVNNLLQQKRAIGKTEAQVRSATIDDDLFKTLATNAGLEAYSPKGDTEKSSLGRLKNEVETQIDAEQTRTGKALTRDQKAAIMTDMIDKKVMLSYWGSDPEVIASMVTNAADRAKAYVPLTKIPETAVAEGLAFIKKQQPWVTTSDAAMKTQYADRLQRAYALTLLGGTRAEIEAALKGKP